MAQAEGVAQLVRDDGLEIVGARADLARIGAGVPVPARDQRDAADGLTAEYAVGDAPGRGGGGNLQDCIDALDAGASAIAISSLFLFTDQSPIKVRSFLWSKGQPVRATTVIANTMNGRLSIPDGKMVVARDVKAATKAGEGRTLVLVTARVLDGGK